MLKLKKVSRLWTKEEEEYLVKNYLNMTYKEMGKELNRSMDAIKHRMMKLRNESKK